jgi:hypothetical protein
MSLVLIKISGQTPMWPSDSSSSHEVDRWYPIGATTVAGRAIDGGPIWHGHDGDQIRIIDLAVDHPADSVDFVLHTQAGMWWKGITIVDPLHEAGVIVDGIQVDNGGGAGATSDKTRLNFFEGATYKGKWLVFWKAKFAGNHTPIYLLDGGDLSAFSGMSITFDWLHD